MEKEEKIKKLVSVSERLQREIKNIERAKEKFEVENKEIKKYFKYYNKYSDERNIRILLSFSNEKFENTKTEFRENEYTLYSLYTSENFEIEKVLFLSKEILIKCEYETLRLRWKTDKAEKILKTAYLKSEIQERKEKLENIFSKIQDETIHIATNQEGGDFIEPELYTNYVVFYDNTGDGGYRHRYTKTYIDVIDRDFINGMPAFLIKQTTVTYYFKRIRGKTEKNYLVGWDDGHLFLTQVYSTTTTVKEAIERLIPLSVKKAKEKGKEVVRWGDIWFIKTNKKITDKIREAAKEEEIRENHKVLTYREGRKAYAVKIIGHPEHKTPKLDTEYLYQIERNKMVSRNRSYD